MLTSIFFVASVALAQVSVQYPELGDVALAQALLDLGNPYRLMCVAAHPDDEDGATLAYYRMKYGTETMAVIATRGEGGQNEIGPELYEELAVIRTKEMQAAAKIEGAYLRFLDLPEFGFSKSIDETLEVWGEEETLRRVVREIRAFRPHVIITHHGRMKDHGHHQAIGAAVQAAFDAAADGTRFPDDGDAWQVSRLYIRNWEGSEEAVQVPIAELEPHRGKTYAEIAASALMEHKSQGMQQFIDRLLYERPTVYYDLVKAGGESGASGANFGPLFAGVPPGAARLAVEAGPRAEQLEETLLEALNAVAPAEDPDQATLRHELEQAVAAAAQVRLSARALDPVAVPGQQLTLKSVVEDFGAADVERVEIITPTNTSSALAADSVLDQGVTLPPDLPLTLPAAEHLRMPRMHPFPLQMRAEVLFQGVSVALSVPLDVQIAAPLELKFEQAPYLLRQDAARSIEVPLTVTQRAPGHCERSVQLEPPPGWTVKPESFTLSFTDEDQERRVVAELQAPADSEPGMFSLRAHAEGAEPVEARVECIVVAVPGEVRVGVIQSYDDTFAKTLARLGVRHEVLEPRDLSVERLAGFTSVIVDIRAYRYRPGLTENNAALLEYVKRGGTLLVMYHKTFDWDPSYAPYPITLSNNRVTREDAPVEVLVPEHPIFTSPNEIRAEDWEGWLQERGLYFPSEWDAAYTPLVAMADPGERIPPGSMLIAQYGEGTYLYTALGWYRQLRELHPGALRIFANMLNLKN